MDLMSKLATFFSSTETVPSESNSFETLYTAISFTALVGLSVTLIALCLKKNCFASSNSEEERRPLSPTRVL